MSSNLSDRMDLPRRGMFTLLFAVLVLGFCSSCATVITGQVEFVDEQGKPEDRTKQSRALINIIRVDSARIDGGALTFQTEENGSFDSAKHMTLEKGLYNIEVYKHGYSIESVSAKIDGAKSFSFKLRKLKPLEMKAFGGRDKERQINASGSVSIQPPQL